MTVYVTIGDLASRVYRNQSQDDANKLISRISTLRAFYGWQDIACVIEVR